MNSNYSLLHSVLCLSHPLYHYWTLAQIYIFWFYDWLILTRAIYVIIELELPLESDEDIRVHTTEDNDLDSPCVYQKQIAPAVVERSPSTIYVWLLTGPFLCSPKASVSLCLKWLYLAGEVTFSSSSPYLLTLTFFQAMLYMSYLGRSSDMSLILCILWRHESLHSPKFIGKSVFLMVHLWLMQCSHFKHKKVMKM